MSLHQINDNQPNNERISAVKTLLSTLVSEYDANSKLNGQWGVIFKSIQSVSSEYSHLDNYYSAKLHENRNRNRYLDILPFENTRFKSPNLPYINANCVDASYINCNYILSQGPLDGFIEEFWTMIWDSDASIIVCLANRIENDKIKFDSYYDDDYEVSHGKYQIKTVIKKYCGNNIIVRKITIVKYETLKPEYKTIRHIQYTGWPDHGIPSNISEFLEICTTIDSYRSCSPVVVHCSAGIGRTGTLCVVHIIINLIKRFLRGEDLNWSDLPMFSSLNSQKPDNKDNFRLCRQSKQNYGSGILKANLILSNKNNIQKQSKRKHLANKCVVPCAKTDNTFKCFFLSRTLPPLQNISLQSVPCVQNKISNPIRTDYQLSSDQCEDKNKNQEMSNFKIDIAKLIIELRKFRYKLVQMEDQFVFCFRASIEGISKLLAEYE